MFNFFFYIPKLIKILYIISKYRIITEPGKIKLPFSIKFLGFLCSSFLYPKALFIKANDSFGKRLTDCFTSLGPIYIKLGQTLSTRPDLIGLEVAENLKSLQDKLPAFDKEIVKDTIESQFNNEVDKLFKNFDYTPIAAASIAQVHKASLPDGTKVAVKILRPDVKSRYEKDISFLEYFAHLTTKFLKKAKRLKPKEVIQVFRKTMQMELDLRLEAAAASQIYDNFVEDDSLLIPKIYWNLTSEHIITLEWVEGVSIYEKDAIEKMGHQPRDIAAKIAIIFFNQAYRDGFFHADLHPGNILVCADGRIALVDFGIIGILPEDDRLAIAEILHAFLQRNYKLVAEIHHRIKYIPENTNLDSFAQSCRAVTEPIMGLAVKDISIGNLLAQLFKITEEYGMETQPQLLLLQKTMVVVEGIGQCLDSETNMWQLAEPWIKKWAVKNITPEAKFLRFMKKLINKLI